MSRGSPNPNRTLPFLPGYTVNHDTRTNFHKKQIFGVKAGLPVVADLQTQPNIGDELENNAVSDSLYNFNEEENKSSSRSGNQSASGLSRVPAWVAYDRKVLRFFAYFKEEVHQSPQEQWRARKCILYFYLEDDSMHIAEPREPNSGIPQGVFLKRHRVPKDAYSFFTIDDLRIGADLNVYGRDFHLYDCDEFTRSFYHNMEVDVGDPEECPSDAFTMRVTSRRVDNFNKKTNPLKTFMEANLGKPMGVGVDRVRKFLENDRRVLRFYCLWEDPSLYGEKRPYVLHYFLADDCVEVLEVTQANNGRDPFPALLKKQRLPKNFRGGVVNTSTRHVENDEDFYNELDFRVGSTINVYGRQFFIYSCDEFTKSYYAEVHGLGSDEFAETKVDPTPARSEAPRVEPPPHNGFGTEEDSLGSVLHLVPKAPKKNIKKIMEDDSKILRFLARFETNKLEDVERRFIITYFMADDTLSIYEKQQRNSGFLGGKFLERSRVRNPETTQFYQVSDMGVGNILVINKHRFVLMEADEYTRKLLESLQEEAKQE
eukprot:TRINITY_DN1701_c0_g3_i4.p1 TRINITY_DN1701_c0_g3~~TRINITY_DN1701_c0_g3_i4.p1  ORF type:complete len:543 (+),score=175.15 TRINITY_DN1701_c0_g3_i4:61-1689(+)